MDSPPHNPMGGNVGERKLDGTVCTASKVTAIMNPASASLITLYINVYSNKQSGLSLCGGNKESEGSKGISVKKPLGLFGSNTQNRILAVHKFYVYIKRKELFASL